MNYHYSERFEKVFSEKGLYVKMIRVKMIECHVYFDDFDQLSLGILTENHSAEK